MSPSLFLFCFCFLTLGMSFQFGCWLLEGNGNVLSFWLTHPAPLEECLTTGTHCWQPEIPDYPEDNPHTYTHMETYIQSHVVHRVRWGLTSHTALHQAITANCIMEFMVKGGLHQSCLCHQLSVLLDIFYSRRPRCGGRSLLWPEELICTICL